MRSTGAVASETGPLADPAGGVVNVDSVVCPRDGEAVLCSRNVPSELKALLVERLTCPRVKDACETLPRVAVIGGVDGAGIRHALGAFSCCVEARYGALLGGRELVPTLAANGLYLSLSTGTAYSVEPARWFAEVLAERLGLDAEKRETLDLALTEATANGIVHGNLGLGSEGRRSIDEFAAYCSIIGDHLTDPALASRRLEIAAVWTDDTVRVAVVDDGTGYDLSGAPADAGILPSGRGLTIIRALAESVEVEEGGRKLCMVFKR